MLVIVSSLFNRSPFHSLHNVPEFRASTCQALLMANEEKATVIEERDSMHLELKGLRGKVSRQLAAVLPCVCTLDELMKTVSELPLARR